MGHGHQTAPSQMFLGNNTPQEQHVNKEVLGWVQSNEIVKTKMYLKSKKNIIMTTGYLNDLYNPPGTSTGPQPLKPPAREFVTAGLVYIPRLVTAS